MASLMEELIIILEKENDVYEQLLPIVRKKTEVIVEGDIATLQSITYQEQEVVDTINNLENKRQQIVEEIANVISRDANELTVKMLIELLEKQPNEQKRLSAIHDKLKRSVEILLETNKQNKSLIEQSLEMAEFSLNLIQNSRLAPVTGNYTKSANSSDTTLPSRGMFDAKQ